MNPITSCHQAEAVAVGTNEGTNHYECPICHEPVNIDGSKPSSAHVTKLDIERLEKRIAALEPVRKTKKEDVLNAYYLGKLKEIITLARKLSVISQDELFKEFVVTLDQEPAMLQYVLKGVTMGEDESQDRPGGQVIQPLGEDS